MSRPISDFSPTLLSTIAALGVVLLASPVQGQSGNGPGLPDRSKVQIGLPTPMLHAHSTEIRADLVSAGNPTVPVQLRRCSAALLSDDEGVQFGRALVGSTIGAAVGGLLGAALIAAAEPESRRPYENDENSPEGLGLLLIAGGAPVGTVLNTRIPRDHTGAYVMAVLGEIILGGAGAALGATLGGNSGRRQLIGGLVLGGVGVVFGAAGGAVLAAPDGSTGALRYVDGSWSARPPTVQVGGHRQPQPGLHGIVSLVSVEL